MNEIHNAGRLREDSVLRRNLYHCTVDGLLYCVMVGIGEAFIPAFVLELGLGPVAAGLVITVPVLIGSVTQLFAQRVLNRVNSYVKFVAWGAFLQALLYLPLAAIALIFHAIPEHIRSGSLLGTVVFGIVTLYWVIGLSGSPAWMSMTGKLVPDRIRSKYFATRLRWLQAATLFGLLAHGGVLHLFEGDDRRFGFAAVFIIACVARIFSAWHLYKYTEPTDGPRNDERITLDGFAKRIRTGGEGRFILFVAYAYFAAQIAQPFLNPFMLEDLRLTAIQYSCMLAAWFFGKGLALPAVGRFAAKHGSFRTLVIGAIGLIPAVLMWFVTRDFTALILLQFLSGVIWGIFDLSVFLHSYDCTTPRDRVMVLSCLGALNESTKTTGSLIGGRILDAGHGYGWVFIASAAARALAIPLVIALGRAEKYAAASAKNA